MLLDIEFLLILLPISLGPVTSNVYYIVPSEVNSCPQDPCMTLSTFISSYNRNITSNTTLFISGGNHSLNAGFSVSNVAEFLMLSVDDNNTSSIIICSQHSQFNFSNVFRVNIDGLAFVSCGGNVIELVQHLIIQHSSFVGEKNSITSLTIIDSNVSLAETSFTSYQVGSYREDRSLPILSLNRQHASGATVTVGGALVITNTTLYIENCPFKRNSANIGGAIFSESDSNVTIKNSSFTFNNATGQSELCFGGAVFTDGTGKMIIFDSNFENNTSDRDGGMAAVFNGTLSVSNCNVCHNTATRSGGAVAIYLGSTLFSEQTSFCHNIANESGGTLYAEENSSISVNNECTFVNNSAKRYGGVIHLQSSSATVDSSMFQCNAGISGGVVYAKSYASVSMSNSNINDNKANHHGGVVYLTENSTYFVSNSSFWHNKADHGGVLYARESGNFISTTKSNFRFNTAGLNGGVLGLIYGGSVLVNDSVFDNNSANREGGVLYGLSMENSQVYQSIFLANKANIGGVFTIRDGSKFFAQDNTFYGNVDSDLGAVVYADNGTDNTIHDSKFIDNSGNYGGAVHATRNSNVTVNNCIFDNNIANIDGGTLYGRASSIITVSSSVFNNNTAVNDAVMLAFDGSKITLENITFSNNKAGHDGGAVYVYDNSMLAISNCSFTGNQANNSGGAIYGRKSSIITIEESIIVNGSAQNSGGGVYAQDDSDITIQSSNFMNNSAYNGGVLHVYIRSTANITNCTLSNNKARQTGGAMNAYQFSMIQVQACTFDFNTGDFGGVSFIFQGSNLILEDCELYNNVAGFDGIVRIREQSSLTISGGNCMYNRATSGGVVYVQDSNATIETATFAFNRAEEKGGVIYAKSDSIISICSSNFSCNMVENDGGVMTLLGRTIARVESCMFMNNRARSNGGVIGIQGSSTIYIINTTFSESDAGSSGGVIRAINSSVTVNYSNFTQNSATENGGIVDARLSSSITVLWSFFLSNIVDKSGGIMYLEGQSSAIIASSIFQLNRAENAGGIISTTNGSKVIVTDSTFTHNSAKNGGALYAEQKSSISFVKTFLNEIRATTGGEVRINTNTALFGGGIYLSESDLLIEVDTSFSNNQANISGGGVHANLKSSIMINSSVHFKSNQAISGYGGGINALNTSVTIGSTVDFVSNEAEFGGGISLANSKLYDTADDDLVVYVNFTSNHANDGGALYVDDKYECFLYSSSYPIACFLQTVIKGLHLNFDNNSASSTTRGDDLFGGLLDRCTTFSDENSSLLEQNGATQFRDLSNITSFDTVYSEPIRLCPCQNSQPNCSQSISPVEVKQGNGFIVGPIAAVDQVGHPLTSTVMSAFTESDLRSLVSANQMIQGVGPDCSNLIYQVAFPSATRTYELILYAQGPCNKRGISEFSIDVHVLKCLCPLGFTRNTLDSNCTCICDTEETFAKYITVCDAPSESVIRKGRFWITYLNDNSTDPYFIYPYCPLDYCQPPSKSVSINLNLPNGSDAQCADNRGGILCGHCLSNYSLSFGSSKCIKCPTYWRGLFVGIIIAAILAGVMLVVLLLVLNLTVAVGTLNSIVFYSNIIYVNRTLYFRQLPLTFIPVFISWLNLDIGFDTCFFSGMDAYVKTWLQLAFPLYIIFLVIFIIWISSYSSKLSYLLGKRNPVATLATLILLSYTKLLETIVESLSFVTLKYPNYTTMNWLPDPNLEYGKGKHIVLITVAVLILILGLLYTILITSWQWFLRCPRIRPFKWTRNQKLHTFIDAYHIPHAAKHRYWTGLLLLVRVIVFLIATFSESIDPRITLLSTAVIMSCLLSYKTILLIRVYKNWLLNTMESCVYFNITIFAMVTWYTFGDSESQSVEILQTVAAYLSAGTIFIIFVLVITFHMYRYGSAKVYSLGQNSKLGRKVKDQLLSYDREHDRHTPLDNTLFDVMDSPRKDNAYTPPNSKKPDTVTLPTRSEVSMTGSQTLEYPQSLHSDSESVINETPQWQNIEDNTVIESKRSRSLSQAPTFNTAAEVSRKTRPMLLSFRAQGSLNRNIIEPLLKEDGL